MTGKGPFSPEELEVALNELEISLLDRQGVQEALEQYQTDLEFRERVIRLRDKLLARLAMERRRIN